MGTWRDRLRRLGFDTVDVVRVRPWSSRLYFLLDATDDMRVRAAALASQWGGSRMILYEGAVHPRWFGKATDFEWLMPPKPLPSQEPVNAK
jgi:hypothetical protein